MNTLLYNTKDARNQFNQIINHVADTGEVVWITKDKKPVVKIVPFEKKIRQLGLLKESDFWIGDDFDDTNDTINELFYGDAAGEKA